jgi:(p)ppGpp synthase/HD superfamily hydrolase
MILTERLQKAIDTAALLHKDHVRIGKDNTPYITHLFAVAMIIHQYGGDEDMVIAGLMHDSVEDIAEYTIEKLRLGFGDTVAMLVESLTEPRLVDTELSDKDKWLFYKKSYLNQLKEADSRSLIISAADKIHNMQSILQGYGEQDQNLLRKFTDKHLYGQIWFCGEVGKIVEGKIPDDMYNKYKLILSSLSELYIPTIEIK